MDNNKIGIYSFIAEPFHVDFNGNLKWNILGNHLLNCASYHAKERGFGMATINENHYTWVLSRLAVEMKRLPKQYESFSIQTWVEDVYKLFTNRNYAVLDMDGHEIGYARSVWAMINMETRKPTDLLALHGGSIADYITDKPCPIDKPGRINMSKDLTPVREYGVQYSDIDINGHVNSIKYIEHVLDLFTIEQFRQRQVKRFEVAYVAESYYGDTLSFYEESKKEGENDIEIKNSNNEVVCRSKIVFN